MCKNVSEPDITSPQGHEASRSPSNTERHERLRKWVVQHGGFIDDHLKIVFAPDKGFHGVVEADKSLKAQTRIASCPMGLTLSVLNVLAIPPFENHGTKFPEPFLERYRFATDVLQTFFLMEQYVLGDVSWWSTYLHTLPTVQDVNEIQFESDSDIAWIRGTNLEAAVASQSRKWHNQFREACAMLVELEWGSAKKGAYTFELFRWACNIFGSRSFTSQVLDDTKPADIARPLGRRDPSHSVLSRLFSERFAVLLPLLDILNHRPSAAVEWQARPSLVGLQIGEDYATEEEVFNNYGPRDNEGLLLSYGFVLADNPFEHVLISVNAHQGTPLEIARTWPRDDRSNDSYNCYIFDVDHPIVKEARYLERALFSYDLLDSISVMCSNDREFQAMHNKRQTLMSSALPTMFEDFRNILATMAQIMYDSSARAKRIHGTDPTQNGRPITPTTQKHIHARIYRQRQVKILQAAVGVCAFTLLHAATTQSPADLLLSMQMKMPDVYNDQIGDICTRLSCLTSKHELFSSAALIHLLPSPTANAVRICLRDIENAILESIPSHMRSHEDKIKTSFTVTLSALCRARRGSTQLPSRLSIWVEELTSSYPPEDPNWNYVPPPGPYAHGEDPPPSLMSLLGVLPKVLEALARDSTTASWLSPQMICWAWNVMEEEGLRVPIEIEKFVSEEPAQVEGITGFLIYCRRG